LDAACCQLQWSFRKTATIGTLASQAEIGVWVQAREALLRGSGDIIPQKNLEIMITKACNVVHFGVLKHFNNRNAVSMRSDSFSTMGTAFARVPLEMNPGQLNIWRLSPSLSSLKLN